MTPTHTSRILSFSRFLVLATVIATFSPPRIIAQTTRQVSFDLVAHSSATAIQFDVTGAPGALAWQSASYQGSSAHLAEIGAIGGNGSGKTRYVVYSTAGSPISANGTVSVSLLTNATLTNAMVVVNNIVASDSSGQLVSANPTALPVSLSPTVGHTSARAGESIRLSSSIVDLDGSIASISYRVGNQTAGSVASAPFSLLWNASGTGLRQITALATDNSGRSASIATANLHLFSLGDLASYNAFRNIHFGQGAPEGVAGFGADPHGIGLANGLAFLLGINPNAPDRSLLPRGEMESNGSGGWNYVFRFSRMASQPAGTWSVRQSSDLATWTSVPNQRVTEHPPANDKVLVEARVPVDSLNSRAFLRLQATQTP
jgi:hypothetical protein